MRQSRTMSKVEATANVVVGYVLAIATQIVVFPVFGIETGLAQHLTIGLVFVGISFARGYLLRQLFERIKKQEWAGLAASPVGGTTSSERPLALRLLRVRALNYFERCLHLTPPRKRAAPSSYGFKPKIGQASILRPWSTPSAGARLYVSVTGQTDQGCQLLRRPWRTWRT